MNTHKVLKPKAAKNLGSTTKNITITMIIAIITPITIPRISLCPESLNFIISPIHPLL